MRRTVLPLAFWLLVWQVAALQVGREYLIPGPLVVATRLWTLMGDGLFWQSAGASLVRVFGGFLGGAVGAVLLATAVCASPWAETILAPAVRVVRATPVTSFILLLLLWLDKDIVPAVTAGLMALPVVWENTVRGVRETDRNLLEFAGAYRFGRMKTVGLVYLPATLPYFVSGCRTALGLAWKAGVAAEVLCAPKYAAGTQIYRSKLYFETPDLFAWTVVVVLLSFAVEWLLSRGLCALKRG